MNGVLQVAVRSNAEHAAFKSVRFEVERDDPLEEPLLAFVIENRWALARSRTEIH